MEDGILFLFTRYIEDTISSMYSSYAAYAACEEIDSANVWAEYEYLVDSFLHEVVPSIEVMDIVTRGDVSDLDLVEDEEDFDVLPF